MTKLKHQGSVKEFFAKVRNDPKNYLQTGVSHRVSSYIQTNIKVLMIVSYHKV